MFVKKILLVLGALGLAGLVAKKMKTASDERELWHEATTAPDLR
jgi:hypothetical protein